MNNELLAICIPVYNNKDKLKENILNIKRAFNHYNFYPTIYISDNCYNDRLRNEIKELLSIYPKIVYSVNQPNVGLDNNVEIVLKKSTAKYSWLLGVDDEINLNISRIMRLRV